MDCEDKLGMRQEKKKKSKGVLCVNSEQLIYDESTGHAPNRFFRANYLVKVSFYGSLTLPNVVAYFI